ncbi:MAG: MBOAT family protein, partial [Opitutae bacterium]|nr:MBOAT family protein [Opitutae bacterium]
GCGLLIARAPNKRSRTLWAAAAIAVDVGVLFVCKYLGFFHANWLAATGSASSPIRILLPIGISFFTFQIISYIVDVYRNDARAQKRPDDLGLYVAMFPQLIAGPIVRYAGIESAIRDRRETFDLFAQGVARFILGLGKKVLVANQVALFADKAFGAGADQVTFGVAWLGTLAYTLQIYFDFSGYSDMAIGLGRMFGFRFQENFAHPYAATSVTDFWRRWHISLSTWFRDYVYIPLGGNRRSAARNTLTLMVTWALTGIWHGANWTFLVWGLVYFAALMVERGLGIARKRSFAMRIWSLLVVLACWVLFRSTSLPNAMRYFGLLVGTGGTLWDPIAQSHLTNGWFILSLAAIGSFPVLPWLRRKIEERGSRLAMTGLEASAGIAEIALFVLAVLACVKSTYNPFIYFNF